MRQKQPYGLVQTSAAKDCKTFALRNKAASSLSSECIVSAKKSGLVQPITTALTIPGQPEFFTQKEAAAYMRCSYWAIREACYTGDLPCAPVGKRFIIHIADLRAWFEKQKKDKIA
jgi:excisionase family DNA binding protein